MSKEKREARCALTPLAFYHVPAARRDAVALPNFTLSLWHLRWVLDVERWVLGVGR